MYFRVKPSRIRRVSKMSERKTEKKKVGQNKTTEVRCFLACQEELRQLV